MLGAVPLDPVLQWREQLITDSDVWARHVANQATIEAFDSIAKKIVDDVRLGTAVSERQDRVPGEQRRPQGRVTPAFPRVGRGRPPLHGGFRGRRGRRAARLRRRGALGPDGADPAGGRLREEIGPGQHVLPHRRLLQPVLVPRRGDPDGAGRGGTRRRADRLPGARVGLRGRERHEPGRPDAGEPGDRAGARNHRRAPAAHRDRLADQRAAVAEHLAGRGDGQAHRVAAAAGERAPTALHLRRRRTLGRARRAPHLVVPHARRRLAVDAAGARCATRDARS